MNGVSKCHQLRYPGAKYRNFWPQCLHRCSSTRATPRMQPASTSRLWRCSLSLLLHTPTWHPSCSSRGSSMRHSCTTRRQFASNQHLPMLTGQCGGYLFSSSSFFSLSLPLALSLCIKKLEEILQFVRDACIMVSQCINPPFKEVEKRKLKRGRNDFRHSCWIFSFRLQPNEVDGVFL